eukprot:TRINITY_DN7436_c0_g1_i3.p1 TRINITY_DN7436_c0_g1~~TRINITY_DN7436_c0_g1_i3.p1  ORF type:complete len:125 (+),score=30.76 TRINITY_DN7436_c0_g1_i3:56-376(+)
MAFSSFTRQFTSQQLRKYATATRTPYVRPGYFQQNAANTLLAMKNLFLVRMGCLAFGFWVATDFFFVRWTVQTDYDSPPVREAAQKAQIMRTTQRKREQKGLLADN